MILNEWREKPRGMPRRLPEDRFEQVSITILLKNHTFFKQIRCMFVPFPMRQSKSTCVPSFSGILLERVKTQIP